LVIIGLVLLIVIFNIKGLLTPFDNKLIFSAGIASIATMTGFGVGLLSGYPLKMVLEPLVLALLYIVFFFMPIFFLPLPEDILAMVLGFSTFIPLLMWIAYAKLKARFKEALRKKS